MAYGTTTSSSQTVFASSYRVKFKRNEFLQLVKVAKPNYIFHVKRMYFFAFEGYTVYSLECNEKNFIDFHIPVLEAIEFSNISWSENE